MTKIFEKLAAEVAPGAWSMITKHLEQNAVVEARGLGLVEAGLALASDDTPRVKDWLASGHLVPSAELSEDQYPGETPIELLVVQPFVIVRLMETDAAAC